MLSFTWIIIWSLISVSPEWYADLWWVQAWLVISWWGNPMRPEKTLFQIALAYIIVQPFSHNIWRVIKQNSTFSNINILNSNWRSFLLIHTGSTPAKSHSVDCKEQGSGFFSTHQVILIESILETQVEKSSLWRVRDGPQISGSKWKVKGKTLKEDRVQTFYLGSVEG